ncbi:MAG: peptidoglycan bridge formation glycyltransferase FemA/FemB family protein [Candidatus Ancillula sp.]|jgi:lipid II:glycine glycyltransferase (peptidoglycan interpeptide bridge formation enzyme)|nr:peptidoglycan bridge formation glycyltransferase FemA/FemB family protein [Candidatus Ancillula sp.]
MTKVNTGAPFLQSAEWMNFQEKIGKNLVTSSSNSWKYAAVIEERRLGSRLYAPYGPSFDNADSFLSALKDMLNYAHELNLDFIRFEPIRETHEILQVLESLGARKSNSTVQPQDTIVNEISASFDENFAALGSSIKKHWRRAQKLGVEFSYSTEVNDIDIFLDIMKDISARTKTIAHSDDYYKQLAISLFPNNAGLIFAKLDGKPIASILFFKYGDTFINAHGGMLTEYRNINASEILEVYAMSLASSMKLKYFDFWGVAPIGAPKTHPWAGFTEFKERFKGERVHYAGTWEIPVKSFKYALYRLLLRISG